MGKKKHFVNMMFIITLLAVFALSAIFVAMLGAEVYSHSASKMQSNFNTRTSLVYIAEKVRQCQSSDYEIRSFNGSDALVLKDTYNDHVFETWIFVKDGKLSEIMVEAGTNISEFTGQNIMDMKEIRFTASGMLLKVSVTTMDGKQESLSISKRSSA